MNRLYKILLIVTVCFGCQKSSHSLIYETIGEWSFKVTYSDSELRETVYSCVGDFEMKDHNMLIHHCINDFIEVIISENGSVYSNQNQLIGSVDNGSCLINIDNEDDTSISSIKIEGQKVL